MDRSGRLTPVGLRRLAAAALIAANTETEPQRRSRLSAVRDVAVGAVLGTVGRIAARRGAMLVRERVSEARMDGEAQDTETGPAAATDDAMTRSEEELDVRTVRRRRGRVRVRKYLVTEEVQRSVPVRREEIQIEEGPSPDEGAGPATEDLGVEGDAAIAPTSDDEIILYREIPVIEKRVVPAERVRIVKEIQADDATIVEEVRRERIDLESDADR